jgi:hypothetical protein
MGAFSARPKISLSLSSSKTDNAALNRSTISWTLRLVETESQPSFSNNKSTASVTFTLPSGTTLVSGDLTPSIANYTFDFTASGLQTKTIGSGSFVVQHSSAGVGGTVSGSASASADVLGTASDGTSQALTDYLRLPSAPSAAPTLSKSGKVLTITSATSPALSPAGPSVTDYVFQYSTNGGATWSASISMGSDATIAYTVPIFPATYFIKTAVVTSEGTGAFSATSNTFISAYGYRFTSSSTTTAITTAARYTGLITDTVVVGGTTYTNWKQVQSVKRYNGTSWIDLVQ